MKINSTFRLAYEDHMKNIESTIVKVRIWGLGRNFGVDGTKRSSEHLLSFSEEIDNLPYSGMSKTSKFLMGHR